MTYTYKISVTKVIVESKIRYNKKKNNVFSFFLTFYEKRDEKNKRKLIKENINNRWKKFSRKSFHKSFYAVQNNGNYHKIILLWF